MNICIFGSASNDIDSEYITETELLAKKLAKRGHSLVFGGGATGLMGAAARGFYSEKAKITGVSPEFFNVDGILFEDCTEMIITDTMRQRKQIMDELSNAVIVVPGAIGTCEEALEILTLKQLGQCNKPLVFFNINGYFERLRKLLNGFVEDKFMSKETVDLCFFSSSCDEIISYIENYQSDNFNTHEYRSITK